MSQGEVPGNEERWRRVTTTLGRRGWDGEQIADLLWMVHLLAPSLPGLEPRPAKPSARQSHATKPPPPAPFLQPATANADKERADPSTTKPKNERKPDQPRALLEPATGAGSLPAEAPAVGVRDPGLLPRPRRLGRALAPLGVWVREGPAHHLDVPATVEEIARARAEGRRWQPVLTARREPWLSVDLVFDNGPSMVLWRQLRRELPRRLGREVRWRDLRCWLMSRDRDGGVGLRGLQGSGYAPKLLRRVAPRELVMVVSDAVDPLWFDGAVATLLRQWAAHQPVVLLQVLPRRLWARTALAQQSAGWVHATRPLQPNGQLRWTPFTELVDDPEGTGDPPTRARPFALPVATLDPEDLGALAKVLVGVPGNSLLACHFAPRATALAAMAKVTPPSLEERLAVFLFSASGGARRLLGLLTFAPLITLPVVRLIQERIARGSPSQLAEVVLSGLLVNAAARGEETIPIDRQLLRFSEETLRPRLREGLRIGEARDVFDLVEEHVAASLGRSVEEFEALLRQPRLDNTDPNHALLEAFATIAPSCLKGLGSRYEALATAIESAWQRKKKADIPELETIAFEAGRIEFVELRPIQFATGQTWAFWEPLFQNMFPTGATAQISGPLSLTMVEIPAGEFMMGSPKEERGRYKTTEEPQHRVFLESFYMCQMPITQAQWRAVAQWEQQNGESWERDLNISPSHFQPGWETTDLHPVEQINWHEAIEFCNRISQRTGRTYTLPSEAQWEYACRAGTTTPFAFGDTLTANLANYNSTETYSDEDIGTWRQHTSPVGRFPANNWGLHDMHGNVWEWCLDNWHDNYLLAPQDGQPWIYNIHNNNDKKRLLRGGSWHSKAGSCRSASRFHGDPNYISRVVGFRVICRPNIVTHSPMLLVSP
jgi:formylglycine-generating enzyme required for sulfatase activity